MAKFPNGINGPFSGKIGTVVGVIVGNKNYGRSKPKINPKKRTLAQKAQSNKITVLSTFTTPLKDFFSISFQEKGIEMDMNAASAARSSCLLNGTKGTYPNQEIDWENILVSEGSLAAPEQVSVNTTYAGFEFSWDKQYDINHGLPSDRTMMVIYSKDKKRTYTNFSGAQRKELKDFFAIDKAYKGKSFHIFLCFKEVKTNRVSKSVYCGEHIFKGVSGKSATKDQASPHSQP